MTNHEPPRREHLAAMNKKTITDRDIQALVDNELSPEQAARVREYLLHHPRARHRYESLVRQKRLLQEWWRKRRH
jgi:anti-sigma factor RsiW